MERFNPFSDTDLHSDINQDPCEFSSTSRSSQLSRNQSASQVDPPSGSAARQPASSSFSADITPTQNSKTTSRYSTSFPDPFGEQNEQELNEARVRISAESSSLAGGSGSGVKQNNRSNSVTFAPTSSQSIDDSLSGPSRLGHGRQTTSGGLSSFLSRATSVTSSTVTDRVSGAVGSMRSAVDSLSSQLQQAVPTNLNERLTSTASNLIGSTAGGDQPQQSAASYLASKISSATGQFTSSVVAQNSGSMPLISRQRVILILDSLNNADWAQLFTNYRRLMSSGPNSSGGATQSTLTSFFSSATAQLTSSSTSASASPPTGNLLISSPRLFDGVDLIEQADFRDVSVLANQTTSTATVYVSGSSINSSNTSTRSLPSSTGRARIIRPEYVVVRQKTKEQAEHLRGIVTALNYCLVPLFEPLEIWNTFQDKRLIFAKLLNVQKTLGKEHFPLIPQVYCQTHQDLLNYINNSAITLPCLVRTGPRGKIKIENLQMLKDLSSIVATSSAGCTIEQYLDVKYDLIVQKLGTSLKLFKRSTQPAVNSESSSMQSQQKQSASRQTSIGGSVLSNFMPNSQQQQVSILRRSSNPITGGTFEKLSEVNVRYRNWIESIVREFDNKLEAVSLKIVVASNDREYIVGLTDITENFKGSQENQDEDKRSFVELILSNMNTNLPNPQLSRETSLLNNASSSLRKRSGSNEENNKQSLQDQLENQLRDKKKFVSQSQINGTHSSLVDNKGGINQQRNYGQLSSRSQSVSVNQSDYLANEQQALNRSYFGRRGSDRTDSITNDGDDSSLGEGQITASNSSGLHQRQTSLGQSFFDQTSTALSSFQKQSMSFFRRLDARPSNEMSSTPPLSAKSDKAFDRSFMNASEDPLGRNSSGFKSQSIDSSTIMDIGASRLRKSPPKPPPPVLTGTRQSSLASYSSQRATSFGNTTPNSTPSQTRQNSSVAGETNVSNQSKTRVVRQNSALSAFEPFDPELSASPLKENNNNNDNSANSAPQNVDRTSSTLTGSTDKLHQHKSAIDSIKKATNFDSASITSGDSNSTNETTTAEDTMNNLKKTFASIFGDKCE